MSLIPAVVIDTNLKLNLEYQFNSWTGPLAYGSNLWFVATQGSPTYSPTKDVFYKSSDGGATWAAQDVAGQPFNRFDSWAYPFELGSSWYALHSDIPFSDRVFTIYPFDLGSGTWQSALTSFTETGIGSASNECLVCLRGSPQKFVVFYVAGSNVYAKAFDGTSWGTTQSVAKPTGSSFSMVGVAVDNANICHVILSTSTKLHYNSFATGAWVSTFVAIDNSFSDNYPLSVIYRPTQDDIVLCYSVSALTSVAVVKGTPTSAPVWTRTTIAVPGGHLANPQGATVVYSPEENYTFSYLLFATVDSAGEHGRLYQCIDTGSGFGAPVLAWDANTITINYPGGWNVRADRNKLAYAYACTLNAAQNLIMCGLGAAISTTSPAASYDFLALYGALDVSPPVSSGNRNRGGII